MNRPRDWIPRSGSAFGRCWPNLEARRVILLSTHLIEDVEAVADRVAILHKGEVRFVGDVAGMLEQVRDKVWQIDASPDELPGLRGKYLETGLLREGGRCTFGLLPRRRMDLRSAGSIPPWRMRISG